MQKNKHLNLQWIWAADTILQIKGLAFGPKSLLCIGFDPESQKTTHTQFGLNFSSFIWLSSQPQKPARAAPESFESIPKWKNNSFNEVKH